VPEEPFNVPTPVVAPDGYGLVQVPEPEVYVTVLAVPNDCKLLAELVVGAVGVVVASDPASVTADGFAPSGQILPPFTSS